MEWSPTTCFSLSKKNKAHFEKYVGTPLYFPSTHIIHKTKVTTLEENFKTYKKAPDQQST
jgi:hypothetical protein